MDGATPAGPEFAIDHDRPFTEFFFPKLAALIDPESVVFKVRYRGDPAAFLPAILEKHDIAVYPIVIYSHDAPTKARPHRDRIDFPDGRVPRFDYPFLGFRC
jgi:hypothetical protein